MQRMMLHREPVGYLMAAEAAMPVVVSQGGVWRESFPRSVVCILDRFEVEPSLSLVR